MKYFSDSEAGWPRRASRTILAAKLLRDKGIPLVGKKIDEMAKSNLIVTDFSSVPPQLNERFMRDVPPGTHKPYVDTHVAWPEKMHDIRDTAFIDVELRKKLVGFWVEMPLDFGSGERDKWLSGHLGDKAVADVNTHVPRSVPEVPDFLDEAPEEYS